MHRFSALLSGVNRACRVGASARVILLAFLLPALTDAKKFYDDDPLQKMPPPLSVEKMNQRKISGYYEFFVQTFSEPGERQPKVNSKSERPELIPGQAVNTLGEVPDSAWFTNRLGSRPMSTAELVQGPRQGNAPSEHGPWTIIAAKGAGLQPGFTIEDVNGRKFILKFDPPSNPEMSTTADFLGSLFFHALGYHVPENYLVTFEPEKLVVGKDVMIKDIKGEQRRMESSDVNDVLETVPRDQQGLIRGLASLFLKGKPVGEFLYYGTRPDDPNDIEPHEHRRDLRGLFVFSAWLGHDDARAINTLDMLVEENGVRYVKHHLIDFGSILGSASVYPNSPRSGNQYLFEFEPAAVQVLTLGLVVPRWARHDYRTYPSVGRFDYRIFDPEEWKPDEPNPAFRNRLPDDTYWAAKKVMAFSDEDIRAIVAEGNYSNPEAADWIVTCLIKRRDKVGETYFGRVLPLDHFRVNGGRLEFEDLSVKYVFEEKRDYQVQWSHFDNDAEKHTPIAGATTFSLPAEPQSSNDTAYFAAKIAPAGGDDAGKTVVVYLRKRGGDYQVVGIERTW